VAIPNGKIYQTVSLPAGRYQFTVYFGGPANAGVGNTGNDERYLTVAAGNALPDIDNISSALAYASLVGVATTASKTIEFVLEAETSVSLGMQVRFTSTRQNIRVSSFELIKFSK